MKDWFRDQFMHVAPSRTNENGTYLTKEITKQEGNHFENETHTQIANSQKSNSENNNRMKNEL